LPARKLGSAALFWVEPAAVDQLFASLAAEDRTALQFGTPSLPLDNWGDPALFDAFLDPFKRR
jgi:hypothetical protein